MNETVYISFPKNTQVNTARVSIGDCASVWCEDAHITARVKAITLANVPDVRSRRYVFSIMKVIELIKKEVADVEINSVGESDFIISYKKPQKTQQDFRICQNRIYRTYCVLRRCVCNNCIWK